MPVWGQQEALGKLQQPKPLMLMKMLQQVVPGGQAVFTPAGQVSGPPRKAGSCAEEAEEKVEKSRGRRARRSLIVKVVQWDTLSMQVQYHQLHATACTTTDTALQNPPHSPEQRTHLRSSSCCWVRHHGAHHAQ